MQLHKEDLMKVLKKYQYVLLVLLAGVLLLAWPSGEKTTAVKAETGTQSETVFDLPEFEEELARTLSKVEGVGRAEVVLTLSSGGRKILAEDEEIGENSRETTTVILSRGSSQQSTVTVEVLYPTFQGALVVCDGGGSAAVRLAVVQAVEALTGLDASKISVCARSGGS